jgi:SET domain-containing protein
MNHHINLEVRQVPGKGRGVFAKKDFEIGEVIDVVPIIILPDVQWQHVEKTELTNYCYGWGENKEHAAVALGYGSLYNHSYRPNLNYIRKINDSVIEYVCIQPIKKGDECLINYNGDPNSMEKVWFEL